MTFPQSFVNRCAQPNAALVQPLMQGWLPTSLFKKHAGAASSCRALVNSELDLDGQLSNSRVACRGDTAEASRTARLNRIGKIRAVQHVEVLGTEFERGALTHGKRAHQSSIPVEVARATQTPSRRIAEGADCRKSEGVGIDIAYAPRLLAGARFI